MIARVADHCFWFGRSLERAASMARHLAVTGTLALDAELPPSRVWPSLIIVSGQEEDFVERYGREALSDAETVQHYTTRDSANGVSVRTSIATARENARSIREVLSLEVWQTVNELHVFLGSTEADEMYAHDRDALYTRVEQGVQLSLGLLRSTMLHDAPLDFIWLGVLLERVSQTARLLDVEHHALVASPHPVLETALWLSLLRACSGFEAFMKRNRGNITGAAVAAFLILEPRFPRSVRYCVASSRDRLASICGDGELAGRRALARLESLDAWLAAVAPESLTGGRVHEVITHVVSGVHDVCSRVGTELLGQPEEPDQPEESAPIEHPADAGVSKQFQSQ